MWAPAQGQKSRRDAGATKSGLRCRAGASATRDPEVRELSGELVVWYYPARTSCRLAKSLKRKGLPPGRSISRFVRIRSALGRATLLLPLCFASLYSYTVAHFCLYFMPGGRLQNPGTCGG